ncbi:MAG: hypothetical protein ACT4P0_06620 [Panacagrimonas sp.]
MTIRLHASAVLLAMGLCACACTPPAPPAPADTPPMRASVTDLDAFNAFIATRPTPTALRERYAGLTVVLPGEMATKELRGDNSRYFAELDADGRVTGGRFQ